MRILQTSVLFFGACCVASCANINLPVPAPSGTGTATGGRASGSSAAVAAEIVALTNDARAKNGRPRFVTSTKLMEAARIHAQQMAQYQRQEHTISGAPYPTLQSRLEAVGYSYSSVAENIAWNHPDARSTVNGWMSSSGHRANILDAQLIEMGAAMARSSRGEEYWIQVFGRPR
jgi:uncharacterized protein YkwD